MQATLERFSVDGYQPDIGAEDHEAIAPPTEFELKLKDALILSGDDAARARELFWEDADAFIQERLQNALPARSRYQDVQAEAVERANTALQVVDWFYFGRNSKFPANIMASYTDYGQTGSSFDIPKYEFYPEQEIDPNTNYEQVQSNITLLFNRVSSRPELVDVITKKEQQVAELVKAELYNSPFIRYAQTVCHQSAVGDDPLSLAQMRMRMAQNERVTRQIFDLSGQSGISALLEPGAHKHLARLNLRLDAERISRPERLSPTEYFIDWVADVASDAAIKEGLQLPGESTMGLRGEFDGQRQMYPRLFASIHSADLPVAFRGGYDTDVSSAVFQTLSESFPGFSEDPNNPLQLNKVVLPYLVLHAGFGEKDFIDLAIADATEFVVQKLIGVGWHINSDYHASMESIAYAMQLFRQNVTVKEQQNSPLGLEFNNTSGNYLLSGVDDRIANKDPGHITSAQTVEYLAGIEIGRITARSGLPFNKQLIMFPEIDPGNEQLLKDHTKVNQDGVVTVYRSVPGKGIQLPGYQNYAHMRGMWVIEKDTTTPDPYESAKHLNFALVNNTQVIQHLQDIGFGELAARLQGKQSLSASELERMVRSQMRYTFDTSLKPSEPNEDNPFAQYRGYIKNGRLLGQCDTAAAFTADLINAISPDGVHASVIIGHAVNHDGTIVARGHAQTRVDSVYGQFKQAIIDTTPSQHYQAPPTVAQLLFEVHNISEPVNSLELDTARLDRVKDLLSVYLGQKDFAQTAKLLVKLPETDPLRQAYRLVARRVDQRGTITSQEIDQVRYLLHTYRKASKQTIRKAGISNYPSALIDSLIELV